MDNIKVEIYQVDIEKDKNFVRYKSSEYVKKLYSNPRELLKVYERVFLKFYPHTFSDYDELLEIVVDDVEKYHDMAYRGTFGLNIGDIFVIDDRIYLYLDPDCYTLL